MRVLSVLSLLTLGAVLVWLQVLVILEGHPRQSQNQRHQYHADSAVNPTFES